VAASALLGSSLVTSAQASSDIKTVPLASNASEAYSIAQFWLDSNGAALKKAKEYKYDYKITGDKLQVKGGPAPDSKPGTTAPTGYGKVTTTKVKNINLPKTIGKVFFVDAKGAYKWASATAIASKYGNLVATAGHVVYDTASNGDTLDKWVFVPGYYQGKAPWGLYVGKQAFVHYDLAVYEDYDKDYAFVTVYNGFKFGGEEKVSPTSYASWTGDKYVKTVEVSKDDCDKINLNLGYCKVVDGTADQAAGPATPGAVVTAKEVSKATYDAAGVGPGIGNKLGVPVTESVTQTVYDAYTGVGTKLPQNPQGFFITHYFTQNWVVPGKAAKYYTFEYVIQKVADAGTLSSNVGGQGFAYNQARGKTVFAFGYPAAEHPDGNSPYTGVTPKWSYGKTYTALNSKLKAEESIGLKSAMTGGADGGPWLWQYSSTKRVGYWNGVTSWFGDNDNNGRIDFIASPYIDGEAKAIYSTAAAAWSGKIVGKDGEILK
jgi:hypothetical protein